MSAWKVNKIDVTNEFIGENNKIIKKKRVCAYARVSTKELEQLASLCNQIEAYEEQIKNNPEWEFAGIFYDKGFSGTSMKKRAEFQRMMDHAKNGDFDMIITKSISRFARNTIDALSLIQELRTKGIEIIFEKENISSHHCSFDLLISVYSSFAEEESKSMSNNCQWSIKKRMKSGANNTAYMYGYDFNEKGEFIIKEDEAEIVRFIFNAYIEGKTANEIVNALYEKGVKTFFDHDKFNPSVVRKMIRNEKYCGNVMLQKTYVPKVGVRYSLSNYNQKDKYFIENNHEGIISVETFEKAQAILESRRQTFSANEGTRSKLTDYYKFVYSIETHRFYRHKINRKNTDKAVPFLHLFDFIGDTEVKPIYCSQIATAGEIIINAIKGDLKGFKAKVQQELDNKIKVADIENKIGLIESQVQELNKKFEYAKAMTIDDTAKDKILKRLSKQKIETDEKLASLNCEKIMNYSYFKNQKLFESKLKLCKEPTTTDLRLLFHNIITISRDELLFCIKLTNRNPSEIVLDNEVLNEPIIEGLFPFRQTRVKLNVKWKVIII